MSKVFGKNVDIYVFRDPDWVLVACARSCALHFNVETIATATADSGTDEDYEPGFVGCTIDFEGVATLDDTLKWQLEEFIDNLRTKLAIRFSFVSVGITLTYEMNVLLTSVESTNAVEEFSTFSVSMTRCGAHTKTKTTGGTGGFRLITEGGDAILTESGDDILTEV
jgi:hypothetical protein